MKVNLVIIILSGVVLVSYHLFIFLILFILGDLQPRFLPAEKSPVPPQESAWLCIFLAIFFIPEPLS